MQAYLVLNNNFFNTHNINSLNKYSNISDKLHTVGHHSGQYNNMVIIPYLYFTSTKFIANLGKCSIFF